jgi:1,4-dihydroxy-6-naphthoate synthase
MQIVVAHSPDSDDAFMFYALAAGKLDTGPYRFVHKLEDIESLNRRAMRGEYEVTAISIHAYAYISDKYALLSSGASMGDGYGPMIVARQQFNSLEGKKVAIPGKMTTAYLALQLYGTGFDPVVVPFDRIMETVQRGDVDAGLLIHEGQLTYSEQQLVKIVDLGEWWKERTGLPLPLGGNAIRRDLGSEHMIAISRLLRESIRYGLEHRQEALTHAMQYARELNKTQADTFVGMYVNQNTLEYGPEGRAAVELLLREAYEAKVIPGPVSLEFV